MIKFVYAKNYLFVRRKKTAYIHICFLHLHLHHSQSTVLQYFRGLKWEFNRFCNVWQSPSDRRWERCEKLYLSSESNVIRGRADSQNHDDKNKISTFLFIFQINKMISWSTESFWVNLKRNLLLPDRAESWRAVSPNSFFTSTIAPFSIKNFAIFSCPKSIQF